MWKNVYLTFAQSNLNDGLPFIAMLVCLVEIQSRQDDSILWSVTFLALFHSSACWIASCSLESLRLHFSAVLMLHLSRANWDASRRDHHTFSFPLSSSCPPYMLYILQFHNYRLWFRFDMGGDSTESSKFIWIQAESFQSLTWIIFFFINH